ncbi:MAG: hypothetical protein NT069_30830 [Planctomycetota bacterium]|nr:hypothetical protein [Planctomycetota bacterium]
MNPRFAFDSLTSTRNPANADRADDTVVDELSLELVASTGVETDIADAPLVDTERFAEIEGLFIPEGYEPNYAYPLLVWLSTVPVAEAEFANRMRKVSDRNYVGVAVPVDPSLDPCDAADRVRDVVSAVRREFHIHSERIILAGSGDGGALALEVALRNPGWFGGVVALGGVLPNSPQLLSQFNPLHGFRVLLGGNGSAAEWTGLRKFERVLWSAGVDVDLWKWSQAGAAPSAILRQLDRWVMAGVERESAVWV